MRVIGTAGHVDHGKSTLVRCLTGMDPDRLAEEKARQLTIDLGFAWMPLDNGEMVGIVDVPGHRDFIENMLAGVGGIDAVLLVIAADEGIMPQTREHLAILDLLDIRNGLVVLSKIDAVDDPEWLALVEQDIQDVIRTTTIARAEIVRVSAHTGDGIAHLKARINTLLANLPPRPDFAQPRLSIDRVFTMSGFGTVVTGTLQGGRLHVGDEIEIQPGAIRGRIRGLQTYKQPVEIAYPGSRVAVNVSGVNRTQVTRGQVLAYPAQIAASSLVDAYFRHLPDADYALKHNAQVKVFSGAAESLAHVRLINAEIIQPGVEGWLQLRLEKPLPLVRNDRYILRYPSPPQTIGGGIIINPHPQRRWKRFQPEVIRYLETLIQGTPAERVVQAVQGYEPVKQVELQRRLDYSEAELRAAIQDALDSHLLIELDAGLYMAADSYRRIQQSMVDIVCAFHKTEPLRLGIPREELRSRLNIKSSTMNLLLSRQDSIEVKGNLLKHPAHSVRFDDHQQGQIDQLMRQMTAHLYTPPSYTEAVNMVGEEVLRALIELGEIVQVQPEVIFARTGYDKLVSGTLSLIDQHGKVDAATVRDYFGTSRKYAIGLLEYLDSFAITRREGDYRVRGSKAPG